MDIVTTHTLVISCAPGLNNSVAAELEKFGYKVDKIEPKAVTIQGSLFDAMQLNYKLRCANRVLFLLKSFRAIHPNHLYKNARKVPWEDIIDVDGYFSIDSFVKNKFIGFKKISVPIPVYPCFDICGITSSIYIG